MQDVFGVPEEFAHFWKLPFGTYLEIEGRGGRRLVGRFIEIYEPLVGAGDYSFSKAYILALLDESLDVNDPRRNCEVGYEERFDRKGKSTGERFSWYSEDQGHCNLDVMRLIVDMIERFKPESTEEGYVRRSEQEGDVPPYMRRYVLGPAPGKDYGIFIASDDLTGKCEEYRNWPLDLSKVRILEQPPEQATPQT